MLLLYVHVCVCRVGGLCVCVEMGGVIVVGVCRDKG